VNQPPYNLINRDIEANDMPVHQVLGLSQMVYSPLAQGILTGKYNQGQIPSNSRLANKSINGFIEQEFESKVKLAQAYEKVATSINITLAQLALAWILSHEQVASCIIGATSIKQLEENIKGVALELDQKTLTELDLIYIKNKHNN
ncbi:MAG: aldo/keto reductase, partial [Bacilli bacterium]